MDRFRLYILTFSTGILSHTILLCSSSLADGPQLEDYAFKEAILKLDVTFSKSKYVNGSNVCKSEGTGFVVDGNHVITAKHVYEFDPDCGGPTILASSFANNQQFALNVIDTSGDVALLKSIESMTGGYADTARTLTKSPCAIWVMPPDGSQFQKSAIRYGVSESQQEPDLVPVDVGDENGGFAPLVKITPTEINHGESGGPIMRELLVVGMTEAKFPNTPTIGLMADTKEMNELMRANSVGLPPPAETCSPPLYSRRKKQITFNNIRAVITNSDQHVVSGVVMVLEDEKFDRNTQLALSETTRKAVEDSLNQIIPRDGVHVQTRITDAGVVSFEIVSVVPIPWTSSNASPTLGPDSNNAVDTYRSLLPGVLEFDSKTVLNEVFEQKIQEYSSLKNVNAFALEPLDVQLFDPNLQITDSTILTSQESILPNKLDTFWNQNIQALDAGTKWQMNNQLQKFEIPSPLN